jgi:hypothetical protein
VNDRSCVRNRNAVLLVHLTLKKKGNWFFRNDGNHSSNDTESHLLRPESSNVKRLRINTRGGGGEKRIIDLSFPDVNTEFQLS